jgi:hypothetical protein
VEEVLVPVTGQDETKPFVTDEPFDRAVHGRHGDLLESTLIVNALWQDGWLLEGPNACRRPVGAR